MKRKLRCPICKKRALDADDEASGTVSIKCPHCHNIVQILLSLKFKK